jgi:hypothetical protein
MGSGLVAEESMDVFCGSGDQILQWVGFTACARLAYKKGATLGCYVPQSVLTKDGQPLDVDIVLSELASDGTELFVEYGNGPDAYRVRRAAAAAAARRSAAAAAAAAG